MDNNKAIIDFALLSWTRLKVKNSRESSKKKKDDSLKEISKMEEYLNTCFIEDINIIYISDDYYTIQYIKVEKNM